MTIPPCGVARSPVPRRLPHAALAPRGDRDLIELPLQRAQLGLQLHLTREQPRRSQGRGRATALAARTGVELIELINESALTRLIEGGLIREKGKYLIATPAGQGILNSVIGALLI